MLSRPPPIDTGPSERRSYSATSSVLRGVTMAHTGTAFWPVMSLTTFGDCVMDTDKQVG